MNSRGLSAVFGTMVFELEVFRSSWSGVLTVLWDACILGCRRRLEKTIGPRRRRVIEGKVEQKKGRARFVREPPGMS